MKSLARLIGLKPRAEKVWQPFNHRQHSHRVRSGAERAVAQTGRSKYRPHQGPQECQRRVKQMRRDGKQALTAEE